VTPDSFSDGGRYQQRQAAVQHALQMIGEGADIIDIGGESTRPNAAPVAEQEELDRVIPAIEAIRQQSDAVISIDTSKAGVMREAITAGASIINDVMALRDEGALAAALELDVPVCLMHMQGQPRTMQKNPEYSNVVKEVKQFLLDRAQVCIRSGIKKPNLILDPGFGFGKTLEHNITLLRDLETFKKLEKPILIGTSRKSFLGLLTGKENDERIFATCASIAVSVINGADIVRVHDVNEVKDVVLVVDKILGK